MKLEELKLAKSSVTDNVYIGKVNKDGVSWSNKSDITNDFLKCVIDRWNGYVETIRVSDGKTYEISVKEVK